MTSRYPFSQHFFYNQKPNSIILDLDQTLIAGELLSEIKTQITDKKELKKLFQQLDDYGLLYGKSEFKSSDGETYLIFGRPYLQEFLDILFLNFNVSVWTAASKDYAYFVINNFILLPNTNRKLDFIYTRKDCELLMDEHGEFLTKPLTKIFDDKSIPLYSHFNTIILDDNEDVYKIQKNNCIKIAPFEIFNKSSKQNGDFTYIKFSESGYLNPHQDTHLSNMLSKIWKSFM